ncbi:MAG: hypothetical protein AAGC99_07910 [Pseudomonadota bacterium]
MALRLPAEEADYLDVDRLQSIPTKRFQDADPFPWINPEGLMTDSGHRELIADLPDPERFRSSFGKRRRHGQASHDRFVLNYNDKLDLPASWRRFVAELNGSAYRRFLQRLLDIDSFDLTFHWHYTPTGCSLSAHCDAEWKLGSHIFYLNTAEDWDEAWGGQTLILDDGGEFSHRSAPEIDDFRRVIRSTALGNSSLLFKRTDRSWHGMRPLKQPEGVMRKVFIAEIRKIDVVTRIRTFFHK